MFWNEEDNEKINGQDVIGLRKIDQAIEKEWVAGITTISQRAKYISMLVWGLVEAYKVMPEKDGIKEFDEKQLNLIFSRVEFIVLVTTKWFAEQNKSKDDFGLLGADVHKKEIDVFFEKGTIQVPEGKIVGLIGTYYVTSSMFGLVFHDPNSVLPISITDRGKSLWNAIESKVANSHLKDVILNGGSISSDDIEVCGKYFAANQIKICEEERKILEVALTEPTNESEGYKKLYNNLKETLSIVKEFGANTLNAEIIILNNYRQIKVDPKTYSSKSRVSWGEYEARRRTHYALELMLYRLSKALNENGPSTIETIVNLWVSRSKEIGKDKELFSISDEPFSCSMQDFMDGIKKNNIFIEDYTHFCDFENDATSVLSGLALIVDTYLTFNSLIFNKNIPHRSSILETVFELIEKSKDLSVAQFMVTLVSETVVYPHISNTLRKMAAGAKCSLRIYIERDSIYPTGINPYPGRSGTRLYNVINLFVDIGCIERAESSLKVLVV